MPWWQLTATVSAGCAEALAEWLEEVGALSVELADAADQPIYEPPLGTTPLWGATQITGLFDPEAPLAELTAQLAQRYAGALLVPPSVQVLEDQIWERTWLEHFHPLRFGRRLWVVPHSYDAPDPHAVNLRLDPGLAFGTGSHPTTGLCLTWLEAQDLSGTRVVDYGCGSGILAIAAVLLGASQAVATDIDPQALLATASNAEANYVAGQVILSAPHQLSVEPVDVLVANILAHPLIELAPQLAALVASGGQIALSGVLTEQAEQVAETYHRWFALSAPCTQDGWVLLSGVRRPA